MYWLPFITQNQTIEKQFLLTFSRWYKMFWCDVFTSCPFPFLQTNLLENLLGMMSCSVEYVSWFKKEQPFSPFRVRWHIETRANKIIFWNCEIWWYFKMKWQFEFGYKQNHYIAWASRDQMENGQYIVKENEKNILKKKVIDLFCFFQCVFFCSDHSCLRWCNIL